MNETLLEQIVAQVIARLRSRQQRVAMLTADQADRLTDDALRALIRDHATLVIHHADGRVIARLAENDSDDPLMVVAHQALAAGMTVRICLHHRLFPGLPLKKLTRLPLSFCDERNRAVHLHNARVLSYRDVAQLNACWLIASRTTAITSLAREAAQSRAVRILKQE